MNGIITLLLLLGVASTGLAAEQCVLPILWDNVQMCDDGEDDERHERRRFRDLGEEEDDEEFEEDEHDEEFEEDEFDEDEERWTRRRRHVDPDEVLAFLDKNMPLSAGYVAKLNKDQRLRLAERQLADAFAKYREMNLDEPDEEEKLQELVGKMFVARQKAMKREINFLKAEVRELEDVITEREANKAMIIKRHSAILSGKPDPFDF
jgi:hypothetical protein